MKRPNLFIIGAPRCGTTSLVHWLKQHPDVFMSREKEPHFFNSDQGYHRVPDLAAYNALFARAEQRHTVIGEASVFYMYSDFAIENILSYNPDAMFVVCYRDPLELVHSFYFEQRYWGIETARTFEEAWSLSDERRRSARLPRNCPDPLLVDYKRIGAIGAAMENVLQHLDISRFHFVSLDEMQDDPERAIADLCRFLRIEDASRTDVPHRNKSKLNRLPYLMETLGSITRVKNGMGIRKQLGIGRYIERLCKNEIERPDLSPDVRASVSEYFADDYQRFQRVLGAWSAS